MTPPRWVRVVEDRRFGAFRVELRWWHPGCWRYVAMRLRREQLALDVEIWGRTFEVPGWITAEVGAVLVIARLALGRAGA